MKYNMLNFFASVILLIFFVSCQKETSLENGTQGPNNPASPDSTYIDKIRYINILSSGDSSTSIDQYKYDAAKRLVSIFSDSIYVSPGNLPSFDREDFYYNGTDTLPYKHVSISYDPEPTIGSKDTSTSWLFYTGNRLIKDSAIHAHIPNYNPASGFHDTSVLYYNYAPGMIFIQSVNTFSSGQIDTLRLDANENIISGKNYDFQVGNPVVKEIITYDNKANPWRRFKPFFGSYTGGRSDYVDVTNGFNNYTSFKFYDINSGALLREVSYTYQYNALGLPVIKSLVSGFGPGYKFVSVFYYRSL
jgi:hypothetical protein